MDPLDGSGAPGDGPIHGRGDRRPGLFRDPAHQGLQHLEIVSDSGLQGGCRDVIAREDRRGGRLVDDLLVGRQGGHRAGGVP